MPDEARLLGAFFVPLAIAFAATPLAISLAGRIDFHDKPAGYKGHARPTPYLGGAAVLLAFVVAALALTGETRLIPIVVAACGLWVVGTVDDRRTVSPGLRIVLEALAAIALWSFDLGWDLFASDALNLGLSIVWVIALVNAFNLMDNMDGAASTVAAVTGLGVGVMAAVEGDIALAALSFGLAGALTGFLPYNLSAPARIFLGDGGSMPVGFIVAAALMALPASLDDGSHIAAAVILAGLPVLDVALVLVSRRRRGISFLTGGRDHLTHRLVTRLATPRYVAISLGMAQAALAIVAIGAVQLGEGSVLTASVIWFGVIAVSITVLESSTWAPPPPEEQGVDLESAQPRRFVWRAPDLSVVEAGVIALIAVAFGLSPLFEGFYDVNTWAPIALILLAVLLGLVIGRPAVLRRETVLALAGLGAIWLISLISISWSESADQAIAETNRWLLYLAVFAVVSLLLRTERLTTVVLASLVGTVLVVAGYQVAHMLAGDGSLFLARRLHGPLDYVNGQTGYLLLALWPLVAVAERARDSRLAAVAVAGAVVLGGVAVLGQTRAVVPVLVITGAVLLAAVPGRAKRAWVIAAVGAGVAVALPALLDVYGDGSGRPEAGTLRQAAAWLLVSAGVTGAAWWGLARVFARDRVGALSVARLSTGGLAVVTAAIVLAAVGVVGNPVTEARGQWDDFKSLQTNQGSGPRFASAGGHRYDYWRVAGNAFADHPLEGLGAGNYDVVYFLERRTDEEVRQPHSMVMQFAAELGVLGLGALLVFIFALALGLRRHAITARTDGRSAVVAVAAGGIFLTWLVHASIDWVHLIPGSTGIALCAAAAIVGPWGRGVAGGSHRGLRAAAIALSAVVVLAGAAMVGGAALAERYRHDARDSLSTDPERALQKAQDALDLNDESLPSHYLKAAAQARFGEYEAARETLIQAARREPRDFVPWVLLGDLAVRRGDFDTAADDYGRALALNPRDSALQDLAAEPALAAQGRADPTQ